MSDIPNLNHNTTDNKPPFLNNMLTSLANNNNQDLLKKIAENALNGNPNTNGNTNNMNSNNSSNNPQISNLPSSNPLVNSLPNRLESRSSVRSQQPSENISPHGDQTGNHSGPPSKRTKLNQNMIQNSVNPEDNSENELVVDEDAANNSSLTNTTQNSNLTSNNNNNNTTGMPNLQSKPPTLPNLANNNTNNNNPISQILQFQQALAKNGNTTLPLNGLPTMPGNPPGVPQIGQGNPNLGILGNPGLQNLLQNMGGLNPNNPLHQGALAAALGNAGNGNPLLNPALAGNPLAALQALQNNNPNLPNPNNLPNQNQLPNLQPNQPNPPPTLPHQAVIFKIGKNNNIIAKETSNKMRVENLYKTPNLANKLPKSISTLKIFNHQEVVCAVTMNIHSKHVLTGGKGVVKIWDIAKEVDADTNIATTRTTSNELIGDPETNSHQSDNKSKPPSVKNETEPKTDGSDKNSKSGSDKDGSRTSSRVGTLKQEAIASREASRPGSRCSLKDNLTTNGTNITAKDATISSDLYEDKCVHALDGLQKDQYIRSCKLFNSGTNLVVGGESSMLSVWDLGSYSSSSTPRKLRDLNSEAPACYALAVAEDGNMCYACCSDGNVAIWDLRTSGNTPTKKFKAHEGGASCADFRDNYLWTGGLDNMVKCWDLSNTDKSLQEFNLGSQVLEKWDRQLKFVKSLLSLQKIA